MGTELLVKGEGCAGPEATSVALHKGQKRESLKRGHEQDHMTAIPNLDTRYTVHVPIRATPPVKASHAQRISVISCFTFLILHQFPLYIIDIIWRRYCITWTVQTPNAFCSNQYLKTFRKIKLSVGHWQQLLTTYYNWSNLLVGMKFTSSPQPKKHSGETKKKKVPWFILVCIFPLFKPLLLPLIIFIQTICGYEPTENYHWNLQPHVDLPVLSFSSLFCQLSSPFTSFNLIVLILATAGSCSY